MENHPFNECKLWTEQKEFQRLRKKCCKRYYKCKKETLLSHNFEHLYGRHEKVIENNK